jgi:putative inorganic carbon (hco3(-)) transporter
MDKFKTDDIISIRSYGLITLIALSITVGIVSIFISPVITLAIIMVLIGVIALMYYPFFGALAYLVFEYAAPAAKIPGLQALQLGKVIALSTLLFWVLNSIIKKKLKLVINPENWLIVSWLIIALLSSIVAFNSEKAFSDSMDFARWVLIYFMLINIINSKNKWLWFVAIFLLLNFKMSQFQIRSFNTGFSNTWDESNFITESVGAGSTGFFANAGDFGVAMCVAIPIALYSIYYLKPKYLKAGALLMLITFILPIVKGGTRGNILGLAAIAVVIWLKSSRKILMGLVIASLLVIYWVTAPDIVKQRFYSAVSSEKDPTASHRIELWKNGIQMLFENPYLGVGIGNFGISYAWRYYGGDRRHAWVPHNIFIQVSSELGFPGLICFLLIIFFIFRTNYLTGKLALRSPPDSKMYTYYAHALDLSLVGYLVSGSFLAVLYYPHLYMIMALAVSLNQIAKNSLSPDKLTKLISTEWGSIPNAVKGNV